MVTQELTDRSSMQAKDNTSTQSPTLKLISTLSPTPRDHRLAKKRASSIQEESDETDDEPNTHKTQIN